MRKLFVIVLMLALVPFTTGCRIDGLWGFDDDDGTPATTTAATATSVTLNATVNLPASAIDTAGSTIPTAAVLERDLYVMIGGVKVGPHGQNDSTATKKASGTEIVYSFKRLNVAKGTVVSSGGNAEMKIFAGDTLIATVQIPYSETVTTSGAAANTYTITLTQSATGDWTVQVVYTSPTGTTSTPVPPTAQAKTLTVESFLYSTDGTTYKALSGATDVAFADPKVKVTFNTTVTKATDTFKVSFTKTGGKTEELTQADITSGKLTVTASEVTEGSVKKTALVFALAGTNLGRMDPNAEYTVTYTSSSVVRSDSATTTLTAPSAFKFTTKKAAVKEWYALDANKAVLGTVQTASAKGTLNKTTTKGIKLVFDYPLSTTLPTMTDAKFKMTIGSAAAQTLSYATYFQTPMLDTTDTTNKTVIIMFQTTQLIDSTSDHTITWDSTIANDANGKAVDSTQTISTAVTQ